MDEKIKEIEKITHIAIRGIEHDLRLEGHRLVEPFNPPILKAIVRNIIKAIKETDQ